MARPGRYATARPSDSSLQPSPGPEPGGPRSPDAASPAARPVPWPAARPAYDPREGWRCHFCAASGPLRDGRRTSQSFFRHICYGHGAAHDTSREPLTLDACRDHALALQSLHGLDDEPDYVRRSRAAAQYAESGRAAPGPTVITSAVGNRAQ